MSKIRMCSEISRNLNCMLWIKDTWTTKCVLFCKKNKIVSIVSFMQIEWDGTRRTHEWMQCIPTIADWRTIRLRNRVSWAQCTCTYIVHRHREMRDKTQNKLVRCVIINYVVIIIGSTHFNFISTHCQLQYNVTVFVSITYATNCIFCF